MALVQIYCKENNTCLSIPLEKRKVIKKTIARTIGLIIFFLFMGGFFVAPVFFAAKSMMSGSGISNATAALISFIPLCLIFLLIFLSVYIFQRFYYRYYFYDLRNEDIVIKKGVISRNEITLPYSKIQNVYVDQDVFDRIFKLYDVHLETAGFGSGMSAHIDGVNMENSEKLRDMIMAKVKRTNDKSV